MWLTTAACLKTTRLLLRPWQDRDLAPFAAINADPHVMRFFHAPLTEAETREATTRYNAQLARDGFTMYAVEDRHSGALLGTLGAQTMRFAVPGLPQPAVEIGWRLATHAHGKGLATEGARAVLAHLRTFPHIREVVAITTPANLASQNVMRKLGMTPAPELTFDHPQVPEGSPARLHVLSRLALRPAQSTLKGTR